MDQKVQVFHYRVIGEAPLADLVNFQNHSRLRVFYHKGTTCVCCGKTGTRLIQGENRGGGKHWDVYTDDLYPLTVDHIIPKSLGGSNDLENLQPMCSGCNSAKGNGKTRETQVRRGEIPEGLVSIKKNPEMGESLVGKTVWRTVGKSRRVLPLGTVASVVINPHTGLPAAVIEGNNRSLYHLPSLFVAA